MKRCSNNILGILTLNALPFIPNSGNGVNSCSGLTKKHTKVAASYLGTDASSLCAYWVGRFRPTGLDPGRRQLCRRGPPLPGI